MKMGMDAMGDGWIASVLEASLLSAVVAPNGHHLIHSAVLIPLLQDAGQWHLLFTKRTERVLKHKGQLSFPGGTSEEGDRSPEETALREAQEEIGLDPQQVKLLGRLPDQVTGTSFLITPVAAKIQWPFQLELSEDEVSKVILIPLDWLADAANREERPFERSDGRMEQVIFYQPYEGEVLWGATARITVNLLIALGLTK